ncbi:MAG: histidinol dehydrogenase [Chloroflexi bacterium]|nr:histidinol dehydrogenase [Chloroflexota bacterium]
MRIIEGFEPAKRALSRQNAEQEIPDLEERERAVRKIIDDVRRRGDGALLEYTERFDGIPAAVMQRITSLEVGREQIGRAYRELDGTLVDALECAADRIRRFHLDQKNSLGGKVALPGLSQLIRPLERVGVYVPGGTASYPSTVLMTAIPAKVAGVKEVVMVTPPKSDGSVPPLTLAAAHLAGVDRVFSIGGAQAIAALAYGTESVPRVDKICGPGNIYVALAKKLVFGVVGIDGIQGPSEVLIIVDEKANPAYCAADMLAQAEHDAMASAILVTTSRVFAGKVQREIERQLADLPRKAIAAESLNRRGIIAVVDSIGQAIELANLYAPEHILLLVEKPESLVDRLTNAGCIITGSKATVALGDYVAGPSHVLPTGGTARFSSPLNVLDFLKLTSVINVDDTALRELGAAASTLASAEGLDAHARAVEKRLGSKE